MRWEFTQDFVKTPGHDDSGKLIVEVEGYNYQPLPLEIRGENLRLLGMARTGEQLRLNPGRYAVRMLLPNGETETAMVAVQADGLARHKMGWRPTTLLARKLKSKYTEQKPIIPLPSVPAFPNLELSEENETEHADKVIPEQATTAFPENWCARFLAYDIDQKYWLPAEYPPRLELQEHGVAGGIVASELLVHAQDPGLFAIELRGRAGDHISVALPMAAQSDAMSCRLTIVDDGEAIRAEASLLGYGSIELVSDYMQTGALQEAAALMEDAEELLLGKMSNPIAAALGGYALLRLGDLERLHNWPMNLASWFEWLPDGAVIAGELAARRKDHPSAANFMLLAVKRGLPLFSEGYSHLLSRLRYYTLYGRKLLGQGFSADHVEEALDTVQQWSPGVDLSYLSLTLEQLSLSGQDIPAQGPPSSEGWMRFASDNSDLLLPL
ncbi:MAG: hypothetical protein KZQ82_11160 [Candidatus Thiodiazotropha sp. (ex Lucinoma annulata)]|nr:hypothetical protein [Candidatus Thiodiazotropha sp. (ex Troendleina suluensis)]MCU7863749.1 hypothetical protein [Candidatus Thiodiazotropha sp. (ex Lucinoma borealis)]MCU7884742.1 hypothetical protein [Candidatus Thiodiazotropha sp. (ex Lucinoma annulata)]